MSATRDFLERFRPAGAPGAAGRAGVPADLARELAVEVEPVLALLDGAYAECEQIIAAARQEADRIAAAADAETVRTGREAGRLARITRDEAARDVLEQARAEASAAAEAAGQRAVQIRRLAKRRLPELVSTAVGLVRAGLDEDGGLAAAGSHDVTAGPP